MSTKSHLQSPWVEFVLGVDHVIKGFDRALPQMSVGERSTIVVSPVYACKSLDVYLNVPTLFHVCLFSVHNIISNELNCLIFVKLSVIMAP